MTEEASGKGVPDKDDLQVPDVKEDLAIVPEELYVKPALEPEVKAKDQDIASETVPHSSIRDIKESITSGEAEETKNLFEQQDSKLAKTTNEERSDRFPNMVLMELTLMQTLLVGIRKACMEDCFVTSGEEYMKVVCTRILLKAGYSTLEEIDTETKTSRHYFMNETTIKINSEVVQFVPVYFSGEEPPEFMVITRYPETYIRIKCFPEYTQHMSTSLNAEWKKGVDSIHNATAQLWLVASSMTAYNFFADTHPEFIPPISDLKTHFCDYGPSKSASQMMVRACRVPASKGISTKVVFALFKRDQGPMHKGGPTHAGSDSEDEHHNHRSSRRRSSSQSRLDSSDSEN